MKFSRIRALSLITLVTTGAVVFLTPPRLPEETLAACRNYEDDPALAIQSCTALLEISRLRSEQRAYILNRRSSAHKSAGDYVAGLSDLEAALELEPDNLRYKVLHAQALYETGETEAGITTLEELEQSYPNEALALNTLAYFYRREGQYDKALPLLERSRNLPQVNDWLQREYPMALAKADREEEAIKIYVAALVADPEAGWASSDLNTLLGPFPNDRYRVSAHLFLDESRAQPDRGDLLTKFLQHCMAAGEGCPPLHPETRANRPEITCEAALEEWVDINPQLESRFHPGNLDERSVADHLRQGTLAAYLIAATYYIEVALNFMEERGPNEARKIILTDRLLHCNENGITDWVMETFLFKKDMGMDDLFHAGFRENLLDLAWSLETKNGSD